MPRPHMQPRSYKSVHPQATRITQVMTHTCPQVIHARHACLGHIGLHIPRPYTPILPGHTCPGHAGLRIHVPGPYAYPLMRASASPSSALTQQVLAGIRFIWSRKLDHKKLQLALCRTVLGTTTTPMAPGFVTTMITLRTSQTSVEYFPKSGTGAILVTSRTWPLGITGSNCNHI
jgi:hypothetical protein